MSGMIQSLAIPVTASRKIPMKRDSSELCRERASADLLKSVTMLTANERLILERSAASWSVRADMLELLQHSAAQRSATALQTEPAAVSLVQF
jgi:hypothetical protein